jgi:hypothetical protein
VIAGPLLKPQLVGEGSIPRTEIAAQPECCGNGPPGFRYGFASPIQQRSRSAQIGRWSARIGSEAGVVACGLYRKSAQIGRWSARIGSKTHSEVAWVERGHIIKRCQPASPADRPLNGSGIIDLGATARNAIVCGCDRAVYREKNDVLPLGVRLG